MKEYKHVFQPIKIGQITIKNRIEFPPVGPHLATSEGYVSRELIEWGRQFARGGAGIVTIGDSATIAPAGPPHQGYAIHIGTDKSINPLNRFAETIQRYGAKASIQLNAHSRRSPTEMLPEDIKAIIDSYADAAVRCWKAGMDMIMVHGAHGHLFSQFLSLKTNHRTDAYGGRFLNRARLAMEVLEAIRDKVGDKLAVEYRISGDELVPGGPTPEELLEFAKLIQNKIDLIHVSVGNLYVAETMPMMNQPTYFPRGLNLKYSELYKRELKIPVSTVGSYNLEIAEKAISEDKADIVAMARTQIADPDCVNKARSGHSDKIRPCIRCNNCINRSHYLFLSTRCSVNPVIGREAEFVNWPVPAKRKKIVVIGGGPGGLEAARTAAERGHKVVLMEKEDHLGGTLNAAAAASFKADMKKYLEWAISTIMNNPRVTIRLSTEATPEKIKTEKPDVLVIAAGSRPIIPEVPGIHRQSVVWAGDVELGKVQVGDRVVVAGAGLTGSETALHLAQQGKKVTLIDMLELPQIDADASQINILTLRKLLNEQGVKTQTEVKLESISEKVVMVADKNSTKFEIPCDTIVLALGLEPRTDITRIFENLASEVYIIGDCNNRRGNLLKAVAEGFFAAMEI
jgi:2,4-dienoyl-CoA reductase-like NADH-dependent reductase (Old Yellow Enzyme family)/thioredoxin reductase